MPSIRRFLAHDVERDVENVVENVVGNTEESSRIAKILEMITQRPSIAKAELAALTNTTTRTIDRDIQKLRKTGKLRRIGAAKGGYWEIIQ